jgi:hypothetical protein
MLNPNPNQSPYPRSNPPANETSEQKAEREKREQDQRNR